MSYLEYPYEIVFSINPKSLKPPVVCIKRDGTVVLNKPFCQNSVTVSVEPEDDESIDMTDEQYRAMQKVIDYAMYLNPCVVIFFYECANPWGRNIKNFDHMTFEEAMGAPGA